MAGRRTALLVATSEYIDDIRRLRELLLDPAAGGFDEAVLLVNESKSGIERELERQLRDRGAEDTVVLHVAGPVALNDHGQLFLSAAGTDVSMPYSTAVPAMVVRRLLAECPAETKIVLLDGCPDKVAGDQFGPGAYVRTKAEGLTATVAMALDGGATDLSGELVTALRERSASPQMIPTPDFLSLLGISSPEQFDVREAWRTRPEQERYRVPIGVDGSGQPVELDIKMAAMDGMGPHGLCVGFTGSGKTELLRTIVLGLAATHPPEAINFLLVDVNGSASFRGLESLPHVSATITDVWNDLTAADRLMEAVAGEMSRRQEVLKRAGNFRNVWDYQKARENGADLDPLPALLIVIEEFSLLLSAKPRLRDLLLALARLGRSLQTQMLLTAMRPDPDALRTLEPYMSYRLGMKCFTEPESRLVFGGPEAFELPPVPGSGFLKAHGDKLTRFQAPHVSRPMDDSPDSPTLLDALVTKMAGQAPPAYQIWLPPLEKLYTLDSLLRPLRPAGERGLTPTDTPWVGRLEAPIGVVDKPFEHRRDLLVVDFSGTAGHAAVVGGPQSGKSTSLRTIVMAMALMHTPREAQFYCLDFGGGTLASLSDLPHVGAVASGGSAVARLMSLLAEREKSFREQGIDSMADFRSRRWQGQLADEPFGDVFLVVDGWRNLSPELAAQVVDLIARGLAYGVHVITSAERWDEIPAAAKDLIGTRFELRLADPRESGIDSRVAVNVPAGQPGRGVNTQKLHFQISLPRIDGLWSFEDLEAGVRDATSRIRQEWRGPVAPAIEAAQPEPVRPEPGQPDVPVSKAIPIGMTSGEHAPVPVTVDFAAEPHFLVFGDGESGRTNVVRTIVRGIVERYSATEAVILLVDFRRDTFAFITSDHLLGYAVMPTQLTEMVGDVVSSLRKRLPGATVTQEQLRDGSWWTGPELFLVVDDYDLVATHAGNPLEPLQEFLPYAKDVGLHMVVARRAAPASVTQSDPVIRKLKELSCPGVVLSAHADQGPQIGSYQPAPLPAGRGVLVTRRSGHQEIQLTWTEPPQISPQR